MCRLLNYAHISAYPINADQWLNYEIVWLKNVRERVRETGDTQVDESVLEGHLAYAKELLSFLPASKKYEYGSDEKRGVNLIKVKSFGQFCMNIVILTATR